MPGETPLKIIIEKSAERISPGLELVLSCTVNCSASLHWTFNGADLPTSAVVSNVTTFSSTVTLVGGSIGDAGVYACFAHSISEAYNAVASAIVEFYGECVSQYTNFSLQVNHSDPGRDLKLDIVPLHTNVPRGGSIDIQCSVENPAFIRSVYYLFVLKIGILLVHVRVVHSLVPRPIFLIEHRPGIDY